MENLQLWVKLVIASAAALWGGLEPLVQLLLMMMILDIITGIAAAIATKTLSSEVSFTGMIKKFLILCLVVFGAVLDTNAGGLLPISLMSGVAGFFCVHEGISVLENAGKGGVKVPAFLKDALEKLNPKE